MNPIQIYCIPPETDDILAFLDALFFVLALVYCTSVLGLAPEQAPELLGRAAVRVDPLLQRGHLGGLAAQVPLGLDEGRHLGRLINNR